MAATLIAVMVVLVILIMLGIRCDRRYDSNGCSSSNCLFTRVIFVTTGVVTGFDFEFPFAIIIHPYASSVVIPGDTLDAIGF